MTAAALATLARERLTSLALRGAAFRREPVERQKQDRSDDRGDKACGFTLVIPANSATEEAREQCTYDADKHRDEDPARIFSWHNELREGPNDEADNQHPKESHIILLRVVG